MEITNNTADGTIGWTTAANVSVTNNTLLGGGINGGSYFESYGIEKSTDNTITNNTINNTATGIFLTNDETEVYNNKIIDCTVGIMMNKLVNAKIYDNNITNTIDDNSWGINGMFYVDDVTIYNNTINLSSGKAMLLNSINTEVGEEEYKVYVSDNNFNTTINTAVTNSENVEFTGNNFINAGIGFGGSSNMLFKSNSIDSKTGSALSINRATGSAQNIKVIDNVIANTSGSRLAGYGVRINKVGTDFIKEDSNIEISGNTISSLGQNYGLHCTNFDVITIKDNTITNEEDYISLYFRGNSSVLTNNSVSNTIDIEGVGNTVD